MKKTKQRNVIYTAITAQKDRLHIPKHRLANTDYVCFTDNMDMRAGYFELRPLPWQEASPRLTARRCKLFAHELFPDHDASMWMDGSIEVRDDISHLWKKALSSEHIAAFSHPERDCLYDEAETCMQTGRAPVEDLQKQMTFYQSEGMPVHMGLQETSILFRRHHSPAIIRIMESWWQEVKMRSERDQISLPYILWKHNVSLHAIEYEAYHDQHFLHHTHLWHPPEDNRNQLWHRMRACAYVIALRLGVMRPYSKIKRAFGDTP